MELEGVLSIGDLAKEIGGLIPSILATPADITQKARWQTVTVVNQTQYMLVPGATYFESGRFWTAPTLVAPFNKMVFSICNADFSFFTGATGGMVLQLVAGQANKVVCNVGVGFGAPWAGAFDINVAFDPSASDAGASPSPGLSQADLAQSAFTNSSIANVTARSATFSGTDTKGSPTTVVFNAVAVPGQEAMITITQQLVSGGS